MTDPRIEQIRERRQAMVGRGAPNPGFASVIPLADIDYLLARLDVLEKVREAAAALHAPMTSTYIAIHGKRLMVELQAALREAG